MTITRLLIGHGRPVALQEDLAMRRGPEGGPFKAEDMMTEIENEVRNHKVVLYMKGTPASPQCGFSAATTKLLQDLGKPFHTVDVLSSPEKRDAIKRFSNWPTIPQVYVSGKFIGGCDIVRELHRSGELQRIVGEAFED